MLQIKSKLKLILALSQYAEGLALDLNLLLEAAAFEETILLDEDNTDEEIYEIFCACLLQLHLTAISTEEWELARQIIRAHKGQNKIRQAYVNELQDEDLIAHLYYCNDYFNLIIQTQLEQYGQ
jgi:hypothetical protein